MAKPGRKPKVDRDDILGAFGERDDPAEPLTASEVGDALGCSRRTALNRLDALAETDDVASKKVGGRARVWWVPGGEQSAVSAFERPEDDAETTFKRMSAALAEPITVGETVYEDGDSHPLDESASTDEGVVEEGEPA